MFRTITTLIVAVAVATALYTAAIFDGDLAQSSSTPEPDPGVIERYHVAMNIDSRGVATLEETITVTFPAGRRGIYRFFDETNPYNDIRHPVTVERVERDNIREPWVEDPRPSRYIKVIRIGHEQRFLDEGVYTYQITSTANNTILADSNGTPTVIWDVIGSGWQMPIREAVIDIALPAATNNPQCRTGSDSPCSIEAREPGQYTLTAANLPVGASDVTFEAPLDGAADVVVAEEPGNDQQLAGYAVLALLALGGAIIVRSRQQRPPGFPIVYEPPPTLTPAGCATLVDGVPPDNALLATLLDLARCENITLATADGASWTIAHTGKEPRPEYREVLRTLGLHGAGAIFHADNNAAAGHVLERAGTAAKDAARASSRRYITTSTRGNMYKLTAAFMWIALVLAAGLNLFLYVAAPPLAVAAVAGLAAGFTVAWGMPRLTRVRTLDEAHTWAHAGGFRRFLATDSSEDRFNAAARMDLFHTYLPWAVAYGVADAWEKKYRTQESSQLSHTYTTLRVCIWVCTAVRPCPR